MNIEIENRSGAARGSTRAVEWLRTEYRQRRARNSQYSMRAFARLVGLSPGALSEILLEKRPLSEKTARRIADRLSFSPEERKQFVELSSGPNAGFAELTEDSFQVIAAWHHYAILTLIETVDFKSDTKWIASRLGITIADVKNALQRLERLGLVRYVGGNYTVVANVTTTDGVPSAALRQAHREELEHAIRALEEFSICERSVTSITMAIDVTKIEKAKELIRKFRRDIARVLESGNRTEVYNLNIQLIPLTKGGHNERVGDNSIHGNDGAQHKPDGNGGGPVCE